MAARWQAEVVETHPLLVVGQHGQGRTAAIATDVAPHWVGGLVDWGDDRVTGQGDGADDVEVGDLYAQFWRQLLSFVKLPSAATASSYLERINGSTSSHVTSQRHRRPIRGTDVRHQFVAGRHRRCGPQVGKIDRVFGMRFGIEGVLNNHLVDLFAQPAAVMDGLRRTPSSALGSTRLKLQEEHFGPILEQLRRHKIRYFFMIGGNDTMDTIHRITEYAAAAGL